MIQGRKQNTQRFASVSVCFSLLIVHGPPQGSLPCWPAVTLEWVVKFSRLYTHPRFSLSLFCCWFWDPAAGPHDKMSHLCALFTLVANIVSHRALHFMSVLCSLSSSFSALVFPSTGQSHHWDRIRATQFSCHKGKGVFLTEGPFFFLRE